MPIPDKGTRFRPTCGGKDTAPFDALIAASPAAPRAPSAPSPASRALKSG